MDGDFVLDGEIDALNDQGRPSFQLLQNGRARPALRPSEPFSKVQKTLLAMKAQILTHDTWLADEDPTAEPSSTEN